VTRQRLVEWAVITALAIAVTMIGRSDPGALEYRLLDLRFAIARSVETRPPLVRTAVVLGDYTTESALGRPLDSSWREFYPDLIDVLQRAGARLIVWDMVFVADAPAYDDEFRHALLEGPPSIAGRSAESPPSDRLERAFVGFGLTGLITIGSVPRRAVADVIPRLGALAAYHALMLEDDVESGRRAKELIQAATENDRWLDFAFDLNEVPSFSMIDVMNSDNERLGDEAITPLSVFRDRVVFVGSDISSTDRHVLPGSGSATVPGVLAHVVAMYSYLSDRPIVRTPGYVGRATALPLALLIGFVLSSLHRRARTWGTVLVFLVAIVVPPVLFSTMRIWLPWAIYLAAPMAGLLAAVVVRTIKLNRRYRASLGFDPELIAPQHRSGDSVAVERYGVVLCADVRNYTEYVTDHPSDIVQRVMQEYLAEMEGVIDSCGGYVNKYVGDEIVAVFGFPLSEEEVESRAVKAALAMLSRLEELRNVWKRRGTPPLEAIGVGIDAGSLRFSHIGGSRRIQFDIIGNATNGAHRLQELCKVHGRAIILPAEVVEEQELLEVALYGAEPASDHSVSFIGEAQIRGQGRRRLYGLTERSGENDVTPG
jgi:class 3 adenylate cyclase/CHASE2 domain-containing sensor protein